MKKGTKAAIITPLLSVSLLTFSKSIDVKDIVKPSFYQTYNNEIEIPHYIKDKYGINNNNVNFITELDLELNSNSDSKDLNWLNSCVNLQRLTLSIYDPQILNSIKKLPNLNYLEIRNLSNKKDQILNKSNCSFIVNSKNLNTFVIGDYNIQEGFIESLTNLKVLNLSTKKDSIISNYSFNYYELGFLDKIIIHKPFSLIIHMDYNELYHLINSNTVIYHSNDKKENDITYDLLAFDRNIDLLINKLKVNKSDDDYTKIKKALIYTMNRLEYGNYDNLTNREIKDKYYLEGYLYGALNNKEAICGNYAALFGLLLDRLNIDDYIAINDNHAFNIVNINDETYYIDPTGIDTLYKDNQPFYMEDNSICTASGEEINDIFEKIKYYTINIPENFLYNYNIRNNGLIFSLIVSSLLIGQLMAFKYSKKYEEKLKEERNIKRIKKYS